MRIKYHNTLEDALAWNRFYLGYSPEVRRHSRRVSLCVAGIGLCTGALTALYGQFIWTVFSVVAGTAIALYTPRLLRRAWDTRAARSFAEGGGKGFLGNHELVLQETALFSRSDIGETTQKLESFEGVESAPDHTFVLVNKTTAHVIPRAFVSEGDYEGFVSELKRRYAESTP